MLKTSYSYQKSEALTLKPKYIPLHDTRQLSARRLDLCLMTSVYQQVVAYLAIYILSNSKHN